MEFNEEVSVRHLVEFILRSGDLFSDAAASQHTAAAGSAIHRSLQKKSLEQNASYQKEVAFAFNYPLNGVAFTIRGRADGLVRVDDVWKVEEIKTSETPLRDLPASQVDLFFAQGMCYAYFLSVEKKLAQVDVELVYFEVGTKDVQRVLRHFTQAELQTFFATTMAGYYEWYAFMQGVQQQLTETAQGLAFPYENFRRGQRELMVVCHKAIQLKKQLFMQAPTGTGKTISTLFPAVLGLGQEKFPRVFYLTAKTITRQVVEEGMSLLRGQNLRAKSITLTAKDKICFSEGRCNPRDCPFAKGYYDRVNDGLMDLLTHEDALTREVIERYARKHTLCPFEFSLDAALFCQIIIGDYNYVYDPLVYLRRFFDEMTAENAPLLLVDEAHNLVERSKNMYSKSLSLKKAQHATRLFKEVSGQDALGKKIRRLFNKLVKLLKEQEAAQTPLFAKQVEAFDALTAVLATLTENLRQWMAENSAVPAEELRDWSFEAYSYFAIGELYNDKFVTTFEKTARGDFVVSELCLDPSEFLRGRHGQVYNSVLFSATLTPVSYYKERLGELEAVNYVASSPFPAANQRVIIADYIETTYQKRPASLPKIVEALELMVTEQAGNYFVFAPSYVYLKEIYLAFQEATAGRFELQIQEREMDEVAREKFLATFRGQQKPVIGFALLGGIFSEGVDLPGTALVGAAIVGVGLPQLNPTTDLERDYFQGKNGQGFQFAYQLPGMNKVLQAAGRVIRTPEDRGVILLLDARFTAPHYKKLLPPNWQIGVAHNARGLASGLADFWHPVEKLE